jgi:hypothetical protein
VNRIDDLAGRLESIVADLDELAFDRLREAVADGATQRPAADKELAKARRAAEKAARHLRQIGEDSDPSL